MIRRAALLAGTYLALACAGAALADDQATRYQSWGAGPGGSTQDMVKALRELIDEAEDARAADPRFLTDLKALANAFDESAPVELMHDDFRDGDYTRGVVWQVTRGNWWVESAVGLRSVVSAPAAMPVQTAPQEPERRADDDLADAIIGTILEQMVRPREGSTAEPAPSQPEQAGVDTLPAEIQVQRSVPNAFSVRLEITSRARYGELRVGPYQGSTQYGWGYMLAYGPGSRTGLRLMRVARGQHTVIGYHDGVIDLEDGRLHVIDWNRSLSGEMTVTLDGKLLITATDARLRDPFDGFAIANTGGDYAVRDISIRRGR
jgi:hypothetical protein